MVRHWWSGFGPLFASEVRKQRARFMRGYRRWRWHLGKIHVKISRQPHYLWRAVDHEGGVLVDAASKTRGKNAQLICIRKAMKRYGKPERVVTDGLRTYGAALSGIGNAGR